MCIDFSEEEIKLLNITMRNTRKLIRESGIEDTTVIDGVINKLEYGLDEIVKEGKWHE